MAGRTGESPHRWRETRGNRNMVLQMDTLSSKTKTSKQRRSVKENKNKMEP